MYKAGKANFKILNEYGQNIQLRDYKLSKIMLKLIYMILKIHGILVYLELTLYFKKID